MSVAMQVRRPDGGYEEALIEVDSIADGYARGADGTCAFCHADPCGEDSPEGSLIWRHMHNTDGSWSGEPTCPVCDGRPT